MKTFQDYLEIVGDESPNYLNNEIAEFKKGYISGSYDSPTITGDTVDKYVQDYVDNIDDQSYDGNDRTFLFNAIKKIVENNPNPVR